MNKITAITLATSLSASSAVSAASALSQNAEDFNSEKDISAEGDLGKVEMLSSLTGVVTSESLNVRSTPDTSKPSIGKLHKNDKVTIISEMNNGWYKINYKSGVAYVSGKYVKVQETSNPDYNITNMNKKGTVINVNSGDTLNVRSLPSSKGNVLFTLKNGESITITGKVSNGWYRVEQNSKEGFASGKYIKEMGSIEIPGETEGSNYKVTADINIRETASWSGNIIKVAKKGEILKVSSISNGWGKVNIDGRVGFVPSEYLVKENAPTEPEIPSIPNTTDYKATADINLRATDSWSGDIVHVVRKGETVKVIEKGSDWAKVYHAGKTVYAPSSYLSNGNDVVEPEVPEVPSTTDYKATADINLRATASWSGDIVHVVRKGETVKVIEKGSDWAKVYHAGETVYAPSSYLSNGNDVVEPEVPEVPEVPSTTKYLATADINMRATSSWSGEIVKVIKSGEIVNVVEFGDTWSEVYEDGIKGYVPSQYIITEESGNENPGEDLEDTKYTDYNFTMSKYVELQRAKNPKYSSSEYKGYIDPSKGNKYEFLEIDKFREVNVSRLNKALSDNNAGVLMNQGQNIYNTAKKFNIDPLYFIAQSLHETGWGKSTLAKGVTITEIANTDKPIKNSNGEITGYEMIKLDAPTTVYNLYGIGAHDNLPTMPNRALVLGTTHAYNEGWTSVEKALDGAGEFVSTNYINSSKYDQNTIYKMRFNPSETYLWHQYATSPWYSRDIAKLMEKFDGIYESGISHSYNKPKFIDSKDSDAEGQSANVDDDFMSRIGKTDIVEAKPWIG